MQDEKCLLGKAIALYREGKKPPKICLCNVHVFLWKKYGQGQIYEKGSLNMTSSCIYSFQYSHFSYAFWFFS